jgi:hypothetical protein
VLIAGIAFTDLTVFIALIVSIHVTTFIAIMVRIAIHVAVRRFVENFDNFQKTGPETPEKRLFGEERLY